MNIVEHVHQGKTPVKHLQKHSFSSETPLRFHVNFSDFLLLVACATKTKHARCIHVSFSLEQMGRTILDK